MLRGFFLDGGGWETNSLDPLAWRGKKDRLAKDGGMGS